MQDALRPLLDRLPERERTVLLPRLYATLTQTEIGRRVGLSQMHVSRPLGRTLDRMRAELEPSRDAGAPSTG